MIVAVFVVEQSGVGAVGYVGGIGVGAVGVGGDGGSVGGSVLAQLDLCNRIKNISSVLLRAGSSAQSTAFVLFPIRGTT